MATNSFLLNPFTGAPAKVNVTLTDNGSNQVEVKLDVVSGYIADIVGFFANFNNGLTVNQNFSIDPNTLSSSPNAITGVATTSPDFKKLYLDDSGSTIDGIEALDNDVNLNGGGDQRTYQLGVQIGKGGKGQEDDYQSVTFNLLAFGLDVSDFSKIGIRLQSVGADSNGNGTIEEGERGGSSKLEGEVPKTFNISGTKYLDQTGDNISSDDTGLAGINIFIDKNENGSYDEGELKTTTATDGTWSFNNLGQDALGKKVYEILPDGYTQTVGNDGYTLPTVGGQNQTGLNFANFKLFNISGTKYLDQTGDGITTDDTGLGGVEIFIDKNNNGSYDDGDDVKTTTATNGTWSFSNLGQDALGKKVYEILPSGYTQTVGNDGYLLQGKDQTGLNFANFKPYGLGKTPGFWKQSQHFQYWPKYIEGENQGKFVYNTTDKFSTTFGVGTTDGGLFKYPTDNSGVKWFTDSLIGALSAEGSTGAGAVKTYGNISALGRSATAALLNATSDELNNYVKGSNINYIIDEDLLSPNDRTFLSTKVDGIFDIDGSRIGPADGIISSQEVINAVKDVFTIGGGLYGALDVNTLATAFDKMNNMGGG
ncbi:hypothetical protein [Planktothrix agardhii]|uniref:hypothetical protein n=1 Tax=Planktothrix agardhii TaxID=1160 RepID=UPI001F41A2C5|nr:hypothetical protein [Planktothrix agardhii]MCF3645860.1 hypothetical protein [Planktothrix agardhii 1026]